MCYIMQIWLFDPQCQPPAGFCPVCGGLVYLPCCYCIRCGRDHP